MNILVIAEHDNKQLARSSFTTLAAALKLGTFDTNYNIDVLVAGFNDQKFQDISQELMGLNIVNKIIIANHSRYEHGLAEDYAELICGITHEHHYEYIFMPATTFGKNIAPRVGALLDINPLSDVSAIMGLDTFKRPIYAGNAIATFKSSDKIKLLTIRSTSFDWEANNSHREVISQVINHDGSKDVNYAATFVKYLHIESARPDLSAANIVVSGGRALNSKENFKLIENLADVLNAGIGASRAAVDAGYISNDHQVGQTGKVVAPRLYIAVGISGAIQHLAGMQASKIIVAINKDQEAPIFKIADYGLVGDLFTILPELTEKISKL